MQLQSASKSITCTDGNLVEINVSSKANGAVKRTPFEVFWFMDGKAVGVKKQAGLAVPQDQKVSVVVSSEQQACGSTDENRAMAGAILRVMLSLLLNHDVVSPVILPDTAYYEIASELQSRRGILLPVGETAPESARVKFELQSASGRIKQSMYFQ